MAENFQGHLFWDTMNIQNLIGSICLGMMVAITFEAGRKAAGVSQQMLRYLGHISGSQTTIDLSDVCRQSLAFLQSALPDKVTTMP